MYNFVIYTLVITKLLYVTNIVQSGYILSINTNSTINKFYHFWRSTGFCPFEPRSKTCDYLLSNDVKTNLMLIGKLPNQSIKQVRIHWILDLLKIRSLEETGAPLYDFKCIDLFLDWLHLHDLQPGFELMGNPSSFFTNLSDENQKKYWELLIRNLVLRYMKRFNENYVLKWRFETWNEPDLKGYNTLNFTLDSYLSYVSASAKGLDSASEGIPRKFKLGGPAGLFKSPSRHPLCWGLLALCKTPEGPGPRSSTCPLSFISFHKKGDGGTQPVVDKGLQLVKDIHINYPALKGIPIANDEADILTGWSKSVEWRADVRYGAMVVKVILDHYNQFIKDLGVDIEVLSNDNGFLNYHPYYFTQRTLLVRFQMNNTNPPHNQFIKKPVYTVMGLLSYLGTYVLNTSVSKIFSCLTTSTSKNEFSIILTYVNDTQQDVINSKKFDIMVNNLPKLKYKYVVYLLDNIKSNPYDIWKKYNSPVFPNATVLNEMRKKEGPIRIQPPTNLQTSNFSINLQLYLPSVVLIHICPDLNKSPGKVTGLRVYNVTKNEVLVVWKDKNVRTKCILSYEIEFLRNQDIERKESDDLLFTRVNQDAVIFLWFQFVTKEQNGTNGLYKVRAVDYWGRFGPYSNSVSFP